MKIEINWLRFWALVHAIFALGTEWADLIILPLGMMVREKSENKDVIIDMNLPVLGASERAFEAYRCDKPVKVHVKVEDLLKILSGTPSRKRKGVAKIFDQENEFTIERGESLYTMVNASIKQVKNLSYLKSLPLVIPKVKFVIGIHEICPFFFPVVDVLGDLMIAANDDQVTLHTSVLVYPTVHASKTFKRKEGVVIKAEEPSTSIYSYPYFKWIVEAGRRLADKVTMEYSTNKPIKISFPINFGKVDYYMAPIMPKRKSDFKM